MDTSSFQARIGRWAYMAITFLPRMGLRTVNRLIALTTTDIPLRPRDEFPWIPAVEALYPEVRAEIDQMIQYIHDMPTNHETVPSTAYYFEDRQWRHVGMHIYGTWIEDNCAVYPHTREAFSRIPGLVAATVSILPPGETVPDHIHSYKGMFIYHLGVRIPADRAACGMRVGDEVVSWVEGESLVLDPMFPHETWNRTDDYRALLLAEFRRPDLPPYLRFLDYIFMGAWRYSPVGRGQIREMSARAAIHRHHIEADRAASMATS